MHTLTLNPLPPFDFAASLGFVCSFPATTGEQEAGDGRFVTAVRAADRTVLATVTSTGTVERPELRCELAAEEPLTAEEADAVAARLSFRLSLHDDLRGFYEAADPRFKEVVRKLYGYHQVKFASPLENACWAVLAQRTPMAAARQAKRALVEHFGNRVSDGSRDFWAFPDAGQLARLDERELLGLVGNARKARYLAGIAREWSGVDEGFLRTGPYEEVERFLLGLPGIGPWSAVFVLIRGLGRMERLPAEPAAMKAAERVYREPVSAERFAELAAPYGDHRGYWAHYLRAAG